LAHVAVRARLISGSFAPLWCALFACSIAGPVLAAPPRAPKFQERNTDLAAPLGAQSTSGFDPLWVGYPLPSLSGSVRAIQSYGGQVVVGSDGRYFGTTLAERVAGWNGSTWQALGSGVPIQINSLVLYGAQLIAAGAVSSNSTPGVGEKPAIFSWNGSTWTTIGNANGAINSMVVIGTDLYVGGLFVSVNGVPAARVARWDGATWSAVGTGFGTGSTVRALVNHGGTLVAGGTINSFQGVAQWNGATWSTVGAGLQNGASAGVVNSLASNGTTLFAGGTFTLSGGSPVNRVAAYNGATWTGLAGSTVVSDAMTIYGGQPMASILTGGVTSPQLWNGSAWLPFNQPNISPLAYGFDGATLYAGASPFLTGPAPVALDRFYKFNGASWAIQQQAWAAGMKGFNGLGYCAQEWHGSLYVGGTMGHFGTGAAHLQSAGIGKWDGANWSSIGTGRQHFDLTVWNDSLVASLDGMVRIWNGTNWRQLAATQANSNIFDTFGNGLAVFQGNLHAVGPLTIIATGTPAQAIVRWTGSTWVPVTPGIDDPNAVAVVGVEWGSKLVVGGSFNSAGGAPARNLAAWNGTTTTSLGGGVNNWVYTAITSGGDLIVGGTFTEAGGDSVHAVARWDGAAWHAMGTRAVYVYRLRSHGGRIYAAGRFLDDDSAPVEGVAWWTGNEWHLLGSGVDAAGAVNSIEFLGDDLYLVGSFGIANGHAARGFAKLANVSTLDAPSPTPRTSRLMLAPSANPSRGPLRLAVTLPTAGHARVTIHDISGREVARLLDGSHAAGEFSLEWIARVAPGLYLATIEAAGERASARVVRLK